MPKLIRPATPSTLATITLLAVIGILTATTPHSFAQTGASILLEPWPEGQIIQTETEFNYQGRGHLKRSNQSIGIETYESAGRFLITPDSEHKLTFGYAMDAIDFHTSDPRLPGEFVNHSFALGATLGTMDNWSLGVVAGIGYNGNSPYGDAQAWYAKGDIILTKQVDDVSAWHFMLNYNGNRSIFPDIPLPAIAYARRANDELSYVVGIPYSNIKWSPFDRFTLELGYVIPFTLNVLAEYEVIDDWKLFAGFRNRLLAYRLTNDDQDHRRVFFQQRRVEAGIAWEPCSYLAIRLAGGYAFDQEISRGWDGRNDTTLDKLSSEPYFGVTVNLNF